MSPVVSPMLAKPADVAQLVALCEDDKRAAQQKVDGDRLLMHVYDHKVHPISRNGLSLAGVKQNLLAAFTGMQGRWVFDGELLDGVYYVFDLIEGGAQSFTNFELGQRYAVLKGFFEAWNPPPCVRLLPMAIDHEAKCDLAKWVYAEGCEGLVFKRLDATYRAGKSEAWLKVKFRNDVDVVVSGKGRDGHNNLVLCVFDADGQKVEVGEVTAENGDGPRVEVGDVVTVVYQYATDTNKLMHPTLPKIRHDKAPAECTLDQLVHHNRTVRA